MKRQLVPAAAFLLLSLVPGIARAQATGSITGAVRMLSTGDGIPEVAITMCPDTGREVTTLTEGISTLPSRDQVREIRIPTADAAAPERPITVVSVVADCPSGRRATTDSTGHFTFADVPPGSYKVHAQRDGYIGQLPARGIPPRLITQSVTLTAEKPLSDLAFDLIKGGVLTGVVRDVNGMIVSSASVQVLQAKAGANPIPLATASTDDRGQYRLFWLPPGDFNILVRAGVSTFSRTFANGETGTAAFSYQRPGGAPSYAPTYYRSGASTADADTITLREGEDVPGLDVLMRPLPVAVR